MPAVAEEKAVQYLVTESDGTTHLPYTDSSGKPDHRLMGAAWAALHGGYRGNKYDGPKKAEAIRKLTEVYKRENMDTPKAAKSVPSLLEVKSVKFEIKELSETGTFTGIASVYGNKDLGGDVMEKGAFTKTIAERGGMVRLMDSHKTRIGIAKVEDTPYGLKTEGIINLDKQAGKEVYSDLKFYQDHGMPLGLSIGYQTVKADSPATTQDGARHLKEVSLWEVTVTEFPMNTQAQVTAVKSITDLLNAEAKDDFEEELRELQLYSARSMMLQALSCALCDICYDSNMTPEEKVTASSDSIDQFRAAYMGVLPEYLAMVSADSMEQMSLRLHELKVGRMISAANRAAIQKVIDDLKALLDSEAGTSTSTDGAATKATEPAANDHSALESLIDQMRSLVPVV